MEEIYKILKEIRPMSDFENSKNFIDDEMLDSFDIVSLVASLESKFNVKIRRENILIDNFITIDSIRNLIRLSGGKV